jgi:glutamine synthetase
MSREAPVRACPSGDPKVYNFEIKCIDGTSNPYLALSAILVAGMIGVKSSTPLKMKACQGTNSYFFADEDESNKLAQSVRQSMGITKTLPRTVQDAWKYLHEDKKMVKELGEKFVESYLSVKQVNSNGGQC